MDPLSPKEPPRIQHSHHQPMSFFEPQRTPRTPKKNANGGNNNGRNASINSGGGILLNSPSLNLFNQSFDSPFGDAEPYIQSSSNGTPHAADDAAVVASSSAPIILAVNSVGTQIRVLDSPGLLSSKLHRWQRQLFFVRRPTTDRWFIYGFVVRRPF